MFTEDVTEICRIIAGTFRIHSHTHKQVLYTEVLWGYIRTPRLCGECAFCFAFFLDSNRIYISKSYFVLEPRILCH